MDINKLNELDEVLHTLKQQASKHGIDKAINTETGIAAGIGAGLGAGLGAQNGKALQGAVLGAGLGAALSWILSTNSQKPQEIEASAPIKPPRVESE